MAVRVLCIAFLLLGGITADIKAQSIGIEIDQLLEISRNKSLPAFRRLFQSLGYSLIDSSKDTRNVLGAVVDKKKQVTILDFSTNNKVIYNNMKSR